MVFDFEFLEGIYFFYLGWEETPRLLRSVFCTSGVYSAPLVFSLIDSHCMLNCIVLTMLTILSTVSIC